MLKSTVVGCCLAIVSRALIAPPAAPATLLDSFLPASHYRNTQTIRIQAPPATVLAAVRAVTPGEVPGLTALAAALGSTRFGLTPDERALFRYPVIEALQRQRFIMLGERAGQEIVIGAIGRIWARSYVRLRGPDAFRSFRDPRFARLAMNVRLRPDSHGGTLLTTETRVLCPDPAARKQLDRYWRLWSRGGAVVQANWLATVRRRAEGAMHRRKN
jgi:hypothetical protein